MDTVKDLLSQFKLFQDEIQISFAALSAENSDLKSQLLEASKLLRLFTTAEGNFKGNFCPSRRSKYDFVLINSDDEGPKLHNAIFGKSDAGRGNGLEEEEFPDIESYSQSKRMAASFVQPESEKT